MSTPTAAPTEQKTPPGASMDDFNVVMEEFSRLQNENRFSLFQGRENSIRMVGEIDELVIALRKRPRCEKFDAIKVRPIIEEIRQFVQIFLWTGSEDRAVSFLSETAYSDEFEGLDDQPAVKAAFVQHLRVKVALVCKKLVTPPMHERAKRLSSCVGPVLEDLDIEVIQHRHSPFDGQTIISPFLRLKMRYSDKSPNLPFFPPWAPPRSEGRAFELECDETDIDLLIARLLKAKELLNNALKGSVPPPKETTNE